MNASTPRRMLMLLANYSPFLFIMGLVLGLVIHAYRPIPIVPKHLLTVVQIIGWVSLLAATVLFTWVHKLKRSFYKLSEKSNVCLEVHNGPYRFSRHPGALSMVLLLLGVALVANSLALLIMTIVLWAVFTWIIHPYQEMLLIEQCGDAYCDYQKKVRMWC